MSLESVMGEYIAKMRETAQKHRDALAYNDHGSLYEVGKLQGRTQEITDSLKLLQELLSTDGTEEDF